MMGYGSGMYFGGGLMWLIWIPVILALVWLGATFVRGSPGRQSKSALEILDERFARGEIDREEFEKNRPPGRARPAPVGAETSLERRATPSRSASSSSRRARREFLRKGERPCADPDSTDRTRRS